METTRSPGAFEKGPPPRTERPGEEIRVTVVGAVQRPGPAASLLGSLHHVTGAMSRASRLGVLARGLTAEGVARALAVGLAAGLFPVVGTTTLLGLALGSALRVNLAVVQAVNWLASPLQVVLVLPLLSLGQWLAGAPAAPLHALPPGQPAEALARVAWAGAHAVLGWIAVAPILVLAAYRLALPLARSLARAGSGGSGGPASAAAVPGTSP